MGSEDLNSVPHACVANALPIEPSPRLLFSHLHPPSWGSQCLCPSCPVYIVLEVKLRAPLVELEPGPFMFLCFLFLHGRVSVCVCWGGCVCAGVCARVGVCAGVCMCARVDVCVLWSVCVLGWVCAGQRTTFRSWFFLHRGLNQVVRPGSKCPYLLSHPEKRILYQSLNQAHRQTKQEVGK